MKNGIETTGRIIEMFKSITELSKIAIPVAPPSKKPLGSKNIFNPTLARKIAKPICKNSRVSALVFCKFM